MPNRRIRATMRVVALLSLAAGALAQSSPVGCQFSPSSTPGVTYNVCNLAASNQVWSWDDPSDAETTNSTYIFNIGYNVPAGLVPGECSTTTAAQAYQVTANGGSKVCYRLSTDISKPRTLVGQNLYDQANPARGWQLTYPGGDICPQTGVSRTFTLVFMCDRNRPFPIPNGTMYQEFIDETSDCNYMAFSYSQAGCPLECPVVNNAVCGGNGVCGYDDTAATARCFCYDDWLEADCQTPRSVFPSGAVAGATIGGIILGALGVVAYSFIAYRNKGGARAASTADGYYPTQ